MRSAVSQTFSHNAITFRGCTKQLFSFSQSMRFYAKTKRPWVYEMPVKEDVHYMYDIRNRYVQIPQNVPQPVDYTGQKDLRCSYVLTRIPFLTQEKHPLLLDEDAQSVRERNRMARHSFADFWIYAKVFERITRLKHVAAGGKKKKKSRVKKKRKTNKKKQKPKQKLTQEEKGIWKPVHRKKTIKPRSNALARPMKYKNHSRMQAWKFHRLLGHRFEDDAVQYFWRTFQPQMRYAQADFDDDRKNVSRRGMKHLYFIVLDSQTRKWKFPDEKRLGGETLRFTAENKFHGDMEDSLYAFFDSHAPIAHVEYDRNLLSNSPQQSSTKSKQTTTFFYTCEYMLGRPPFESRPEWADHAWVTKEELSEYEFINDDYKQTVIAMLK